MSKIHAYIISSLKNDMPKMFGKNKKKKELIKNLPALLKRVQEEHMVSPSDIPPAESLQSKLQLCDFTKFPTLKEKLVQNVDEMLDQDIAELMSIVPQDSEDQPISGGAFADVKDTTSPFGFMKCEVAWSDCIKLRGYFKVSFFQGIDLGSGEPEWIVTKERSKWDAIFESLTPVKGKISGSAAKKEMVKSKLPNPVLAKVWRLADVDGDGALDSDEFALAMHLIHVKLDGYDLPEDLPEHLVPPSKKRLMNGVAPLKQFWRYSESEQELSSNVSELRSPWKRK